MKGYGFIGMVAFDAAAPETDHSGREAPASMEVTYIQILSEVGAHHHLVQHDGEEFARVIDNNELAQHRWWKDRTAAVAAFGAHKASRITAKA